MGGYLIRAIESAPAKAGVRGRQDSTEVCYVVMRAVKPEVTLKQAPLNRGLKRFPDHVGTSTWGAIPLIRR